MPLIQPCQDQGRPHVAQLLRHPDSSDPGVLSIQARIDFQNPAVLSLDFTLRAELDRLKLPAAGAPVLADRLWEHTCFEAFLAEATADDYYEFNVSPSSAWASYYFHRYREGGEPVLELEPHLRLQWRHHRLEAHLLLRLAPDLQGKRLRIGLSAVIEGQDGQLSYWALRHPEGRPDFHHPCAFALELASLPEED